MNSDYVNRYISYYDKRYSLDRFSHWKTAHVWRDYLPPKAVKRFTVTGGWCAAHYGTPFSVSDYGTSIFTYDTYYKVRLSYREWHLGSAACLGRRAFNVRIVPSV